MSEWLTANLAEVLEFREGPGILARDFREEGVPLIRLAGLKRGADLLAGANFLDPAMAETRWPQFRLQEGDTLLSTSASLGEVARVPASAAGAVPYTGIICFRPLDDRIDPAFIQHMLTTRDFAEQIRAMGAGSVMKHFGPTHLRRMVVSFPSRPTQEAIAEVMGALDNKIAANAVVAKCVDDVLANEFAQLSRGRESASLSEIANLNQRATKPVAGGRLRYLDISAVGRGTYELPAEMDWVDAPARARRVVARGDVVWSTVRPNRRSHALVLDDEDQLVGSTGLAVLTPHPGRTAGVFEAAQTETFVNYLETVAEGSAYPAVRAERFLEAPIPNLSPSEWDNFEERALPMRELIHAFAVESRHLEQTRDELLPLLMSGRIRVKEAQKQVEAVL